MLILGDSISIGYTPFVRELLIWFNFGLHDLAHVDPQSGEQVDDSQAPRRAEPMRYREQLARIADRLRRTGAKLVFATTTPMPEGVRP